MSPITCAIRSLTPQQARENALAVHFKNQRFEPIFEPMANQIRSFRDLTVYKTAFELQQEIFEVTKGFPKEEIYSLTDQIRRSSRSIGGNSCPVK